MENKKDNELFNTIYNLDNNSKLLIKIDEDNNYSSYYLNRDVIVRFPNDKDIDKFKLICPQLVDFDIKGLVEINIDKESKTILAQAKTYDKNENLFTSKLDNNNWNLYDNNGNIENNIEELIKNLENKKVCNTDGLLFSETLKIIFSDIKDVYFDNKNIKKY